MCGTPRPGSAPAAEPPAISDRAEKSLRALGYVGEATFMGTLGASGPRSHSPGTWTASHLRVAMASAVACWTAPAPDRLSHVGSH